jgi:hypothetical protein
MYSYFPSIDGGSVDFAGENRGGIYLDADWRGFFCEKKFVVVKWLVLAGFVDFRVVNGWSIRGEMRGKRGREAVTFCGGESGTGF